MNLPKELDRSKALDGGTDSAAFLHWVVSRHSKVVIPEVSLSFRKGLNNPLVWRGTTGNKTLPQLVEEYQE